MAADHRQSDLWSAERRDSRVGPSDELTFGQWKSEVSDGKVLAPVAKYVKEYDSDWEPEVAKLPVVISFPGTELKSRDIVVGLEIDGTSRAYPWDKLVKQSPVVDRVNGKPILIAVGPDGKSFRVFVSRIDGKDAEFFLKGDNESSTNASPADAKRSSTTATPGPAAATRETKMPANTPSPRNPGSSWTRPLPANGAFKGAPFRAPRKVSVWIGSRHSRITGSTGGTITPKRPSTSASDAKRGIIVDRRQDAAEILLRTECRPATSLGPWSSRRARISFGGEDWR